ncbi:unnamed protein product [Trichogramma brassicae]|uniref:Uncharacterized protein n=1 Tax=Trichogramma brassicae TaxID=86971 RepID=A0A6H5IN33_9HYME|nr:unnamed protein product [Trichogramma brassicae]
MASCTGRWTSTPATSRAAHRCSWPWPIACPTRSICCCSAAPTWPTSRSPPRTTSANGF